MHWRRKWQPTPVFLPEESQGRGSLVGCRLWGRTESDTAEASWQQQQQNSFEPKLLKAGLQAEESSAALGWDWPEESPRGHDGQEAKGWVAQQTETLG